MTDPHPRTADRSRTNTWVVIATALAATAAALAPASLTGNGAIDLVERALIAGAVTFVGSHGRRWSWVVAGGLVCISARGPVLALGLVSLAILVASSWPRRRRRVPGAWGIGLLINVAFRYPDEVNPAAPVLVAVAVIVLLASGMPLLHRRTRRVARWCTIGVATGAALIVVVTVGAMAFASSHVIGGTRSARSALAAARNGNAEATSGDLLDAQDRFDSAHALVSGPLTWPSQLIPGLAQQVSAVRTGVDEGRRVSSSAADLVATADYDRLTYDGRLDLDQVSRLRQPAAQVARTLRAADRNLARARQGWLLPPLDDRLDQFSSAIEDARSDAELASLLLDNTPQLLGGDGDRRYLVVFITPAELRGAGGFIGSYAELTASNGDVRLSRSGRVEELITGAPRGTRTLTGPPDYVRRYGDLQPTENFQDITVSPDFPSDAEVLAQLYPQSGGAQVDGVISVDPKGLAALLALTGPVTVEGLDQPLTAATAVELLTRTQYLSFPDRAERGEILTEAVRATFERLTDGPLPAPRRLANTLSPVTRAGHLRVWSPDPDEQAMFASLGADGALTIPSGDDGFSVVQQNLGNNKLDAYLQRSITYRAVADPRTGELRAKLVVDLANRVPSLDLPRAVVGNNRGVPVGTNLASFSIYTPHRVTSAKIDGRAVELGPDTELGLNVYDTPAVLIPAGASVRIELNLAGATDLRSGYHLRVLPQPVANPDRIRATVSFSPVDAGTPSGAPIEVLDGSPRERPTTISVPADRTN